jgi:hypothetical protein
MVMKGEQMRIQKEAIVSHFKILFQYSPESKRKAAEEFRRIADNAVVIHTDKYPVEVSSFVKTLRLYFLLPFTDEC